MSIVDPNGYSINDTAGDIATVVNDSTQLANLDLALGSAKLSSNQPNAQVALNVIDGNVLSLAGVAAAEAAADDAMSIVDPAGVEITDTAANIESVSGSQYTALGNAVNPGSSAMIDVNATDANLTIDVMAALTAAATGIAFGEIPAGDSVSLSGGSSEIESLTTPDLAQIGHAVLQRPSVETAVYFSGGSSLDGASFFRKA